jgi:hypothetical protein
MLLRLNSIQDFPGFIEYTPEALGLRLLFAIYRAKCTGSNETVSILPGHRDDLLFIGGGRRAGSGIQHPDFRRQASQSARHGLLKIAVTVSLCVNAVALMSIQHHSPMTGPP